MWVKQFVICIEISKVKPLEHKHRVKCDHRVLWEEILYCVCWKKFAHHGVIKIAAPWRAAFQRKMHRGLLVLGVTVSWGACKKTKKKNDKKTHVLSPSKRLAAGGAISYSTVVIRDLTADCCESSKSLKWRRRRGRCVLKVRTTGKQRMVACLLCQSCGGQK
jgi:hypothetical protein